MPKTKPITVARIERCMDTLAKIMAKCSDAEAESLVPLWQAFEADIAEIRKTESALSAARARHKSNLQNGCD